MLGRDRSKDPGMEYIRCVLGIAISLCGTHSEISLAEEAGLECQRKRFQFYPVDNIEPTVIELILSPDTSRIQG